METVTFDGVVLQLAPPEGDLPHWIGQADPLRQLLSCWLDGDPTDPPLSPRITGVPGVGKTTLAMAAARMRGQDCWVQQCTSDTRPEDLVVTPVIGDGQKILYRASPLLTAAIRGGVCVLDEGNRMSEKAWASLASLLDHRRTVDSLVAGVRVKADVGFRLAVTMNEDGSTYDLPDYVLSRLQPRIEIGFPAAEEEDRILAHHAPRASEEARRLCVGYLQEAHGLDLPFSVRDGLNILRLAARLATTDRTTDVQSLAESIHRVLGPDALDLEKLRGHRRHANKATSDEFLFDEDEADLDEDR